MSENQKEILNHVSISIKPDTVITEEIITSLVSAFSTHFTVSDDEKNEVIKLLHTRFAIRMDRGAVVKEKDHVTWYYTAKTELPSDFWERYSKYLAIKKGLSPQVINSLDADTDEMMDLLGNPKQEADFQRRGLVIGDVQSGKTGTYTALINKAADSGYRIIILLTGTIEKLRKQTQKRLDEGFIGLDSTALIHEKPNVFVGVGNINPSIAGFAITSTTSDFRKSTAENVIGRMSGFNDPVLFVLKKNKSVLEKLEQWLRQYNSTHGQTISLPMLLVDDEADSASVNTKSAEDPTAINENIRKLLNLFSKASYVGFTATPYANIFIDHESENEMLNDDLFPRDFIYALEAPNNYIGARSIYLDEGKHSYMLKDNEDCEKYIPEKHKKDYIIQDLPPTLKEAIASFFIANVVRDLRGHNNTHRSMLINVSRFIAVQDQIEKAIDGSVREIQREVKNYYLTGDALKYESISYIKSVYEKDFSEVEFSWKEIQKQLHKSIASIVVRAVNGGNAAKNLNYEENEEEGLRIIAVGGFSLSRGLTLEGLCVSYFYRNSKMYDTLMQMGRWFGYRDGYEDLCQIWMNQGAIEWYEYISEATDELRREVKRMQDENKTPKEFGLRIRSDKEFLTITARNKMKTAGDIIRTISLNGKMVETPYLHLDKKILQNNLNSINNWAKSLKDEGFTFKQNSELALNNFQILNLPKKYIIDLLGMFKSHSLNLAFHTDDLARIISNEGEALAEWDVVIASGGGSTKPICGVDISCVSRNFGIKNEAKALQMGGNSSRLGETQFAKGGLTKQQADEIENNVTVDISGKKSLSEVLYFSSKLKRNPLLVIYPVELFPGRNKVASKEKGEIINSYQSPLFGLSIGIPKLEGRQDLIYRYKINKILRKQLLDADSSEDDDTDEDDGIDNSEDINHG